VGNTLTVIGCVGLVLGLLDIIPAQLFAIGISSGIRVIGSVAIAGCLLSAMGYGAIENWSSETLEEAKCSGNRITSFCWR
jgi:hydroxyethylthiazole kinase-like sugar kinase family protein